MPKSQELDELQEMLGKDSNRQKTEGSNKPVGLNELQNILGDIASNDWQEVGGASKPEDLIKKLQLEYDGKPEALTSRLQVEYQRSVESLTNNIKNTKLLTAPGGVLDRIAVLRKFIRDFYKERQEKLDTEHTEKVKKRTNELTTAMLEDQLKKAKQGLEKFFKKLNNFGSDTDLLKKMQEELAKLQEELEEVNEEIETHIKNITKNAAKKVKQMHEGIRRHLGDISEKLTIKPPEPDPQKRVQEGLEYQRTHPEEDPQKIENRINQAIDDDFERYQKSVNDQIIKDKLIKGDQKEVDEAIRRINDGLRQTKDECKVKSDDVISSEIKQVQNALGKKKEVEKKIDTKKQSIAELHSNSEEKKPPTPMQAEVPRPKPTQQSTPKKKKEKEKERDSSLSATPKLVPTLTPKKKLDEDK